MRNKLFSIVSVLVLLSMLLSACGGGAAPAAPTAAPAPTTAPEPTKAPEPTAAPAATTAPEATKAPEATAAAQPAGWLSVGQVTDLGGIDDKSFNATAWAGVQKAEKELGVTGKYLESQQQSDYAKNIQQFINEKLNLIVTVGFLLGVDTAKAAQANPEQKFAIVDYSYPDCYQGAVVGKDCGSDKELPNVLGLTFATDQAGFLAGYAAAATTKTGKVGTFGGLNIPTVTIFMKGYEAGVKYHNQAKGTKVEVIGWDTAKNDGVFAGNFESTDDGRKIAESMMDEGADIIMPVAGPVGLGTAAACKEKGCMVIGVDTDQFVSAPEYQDVWLTSVMKNMDVAVFNAIKAVTGRHVQGRHVPGHAEG